MAGDDLNAIQNIYFKILRSDPTAAGVPQQLSEQSYVTEIPYNFYLIRPHYMTDPHQFIRSICIIGTCVAFENEAVIVSYV